MGQQVSGSPRVSIVADLFQSNDRGRKALACCIATHGHPYCNSMRLSHILPLPMRLTISGRSFSVSV